MAWIVRRLRLARRALCTARRGDIHTHAATHQHGHLLVDADAHRHMDCSTHIHVDAATTYIHVDA